jgi:hypothetical protein
MVKPLAGDTHRNDGIISQPVVADDIETILLPDFA